jgi:hypothetical protein
MPESVHSSFEPEPLEDRLQFPLYEIVRMKSLAFSAQKQRCIRRTPHYKGNKGRGQFWRQRFALHEPYPNENDSNAWAIQLDAKTGAPSGKPIRLTSGPGGISSFSITANGRQLAFIKNTLRPQVYVGELDPSARALTNNRRITLQQGASLPFSWTPDNQSVIFASNRNGRFEIFKQQIDHPVPELLASDPTRHDFTGRPSPDGSEILYLAYPVDDSDSSPTRLMRVAAAGGPPRLVLEVPFPGIENQQCARSPATNCVFSTRDSAGKETFFSFDPALGTSRQILEVSEAAAAH